MSFFQKLTNWYFKKEALPYWIIILLDCAIIFLTYMAVFMVLRPGLIHEPGSVLLDVLGRYSLKVVVVLLAYLIGFRLFRTYAGILRYTTFVDLLRVAAAMLVSSVLVYIGHYFAFVEDNMMENVRTRDIFFASFVAMLLMWLMRMLVKAVFDSFYGVERAQKAFIYGVKEGGLAVAKTIRAEKPARFELMGFVAQPGELRKGDVLLGKKVFFADDNLVELMQKMDIEAFLISSLKKKNFLHHTTLRNKLLDAGIKIYFSSPLTEYSEDAMQTMQLKKVEIEDLLQRDTIEVDLNAVAAELTGRCVLITGSAGSIGSEIVRQVAAFNPARMVLVDQAETPQHDVRLMMAEKFPKIEAKTIVTGICRPGRMEEIFKEYRPDYVFHAAAYKHVPMMEDNPAESVLNNVRGTQILADLAVKYGTKKFVMVSTDKAVNPTNVMGCSKRLCEIYVQSLDRAIKAGEVKGITQFVTTRFGNVLGSNGSVIPLFRKQIEAGGPVTVTHPDITRYFMLIPEACKLVLEAGTKGQGGEIFVFDMGAPVKIAELAKLMISLSGAQGVKIKYTGLREGEKLYEEVLGTGEADKPSFHEKIKIAAVREAAYDNVCEELKKLYDAVAQNDDMAIVRQMKHMVPEYKSNNSKYEVLDK